MIPPVRKIGLALTFSLHSLKLLREAERLRSAYKAQLFLIHAGTDSESTQSELQILLGEARIASSDVTVIIENSQPIQLIRKVIKTEGINLLLVGALKKEEVLKYYVGTIARDLMRDSPCSLYIKANSSDPDTDIRKVCVTVDYSPDGESAIRRAYQFAKMYGANELVLLRELMLPGLAMTVHDSGSVSEAEQLRKDWESTEEQKLQILIRELQLTELKITTAIVYGKKGFEAGQFARERDIDILVVPAPKRKLRLIDRLFQHDQEFIYHELPCSLLCLKPDSREQH